MGIGEGLETCLSVRARSWRPVWCLGSTSGIRTFPPLAGIETLTIFADNDASGAGLEAAIQCKRTWLAAGCEVRILIPRTQGRDWNDEERT